MESRPSAQPGYAEGLSQAQQAQSLLNRGSPQSSYQDGARPQEQGYANGRGSQQQQQQQQVQYHVPSRVLWQPVMRLASMVPVPWHGKRGLCTCSVHVGRLACASSMLHDPHGTSSDSCQCACGLAVAFTAELLMLCQVCNDASGQVRDSHTLQLGGIWQQLSGRAASSHSDISFGIRLAL